MTRLFTSNPEIPETPRSAGLPEWLDETKNLFKKLQQEGGGQPITKERLEVLNDMAQKGIVTSYDDYINKRDQILQQDSEEQKKTSSGQGKYFGL